jgi:Domain of unknown function (DUF4389)
MARKPKERETHPVDEPIELVEPGLPTPPPEAADEKPWSNGQTWLRGLIVLVLGVLIWFAMPVIGILVVVQFFWMLFTGEKNPSVAELGVTLADWLSDATRFATGVSETKPFPWHEAG